MKAPLIPQSKEKNSTKVSYFKNSDIWEVNDLLYYVPFIPDYFSLHSGTNHFQWKQAFVPGRPGMIYAFIQSQELCILIIFDVHE